MFGKIGSIKLYIFKDSIHIPISEIQNKMHDFDEEKTIAFICHHGIRSRMVGLYFEQNDFKKYYKLKRRYRLLGENSR